MQVVDDPTLQTALTEFTENWLWRSLFVLIDHPNFNPSPRWISSELGVSVEKAVDALEGLQKLNLIEKFENSYKPKVSWHQVAPKDLTRQDLLKTHIKIAPQILSRLNEDDGFTVQFFTGNKELLKKYGPKFMALYKEMEADAKSQNITDVMASELSFVQLTKSSGGDL
jgi:hypothetical protein